jgi:NADPH:quinone reductase
MRRLKVGDEVYADNWQIRRAAFMRIMLRYRRQGGADPEANRSAPRRCNPNHGFDRAAGRRRRTWSKEGETIIIHGTSGGAGTLAVQFARLRGTRVSATASGREGVELVREMRPACVVDSKRVDIDDQACCFATEGFDAFWRLQGARAPRRRSCGRKNRPCGTRHVVAGQLDEASARRPDGRLASARAPPIFIAPAC